MKLISLLWWREGFSIIRNTFQMLLLFTTFLLGIYAIYYGYSKIEAQRKTISYVEHIEREEFEKYRKSFDKSPVSIQEKHFFDIASKPSYAWYRHEYNAILPPHNLAHLSLGQRDVEPYYRKLTGMSLYYQLFENELANPLKLFVGNFDLSFVIVYLFPLLIIAFTYGLFAEEKEKGMLPLLKLQTIGLRKILIIRMLFYYVLIIGLGVLLSLIGFFLSKEIDTLSICLWLLTIICYLSFWFALMFFLISLKKNSSSTAMSAASLWLLFLIVFPAVLNIYAAVVYPIDNTTIADITRRKGLENEDDLKEAKAVIYEYLEHREDLKGADSLLDTNVMAKTYAAFTSLNDHHNRQEVLDYLNQIRLRKKWISLFRWANPAVNTQGIFNEITRTDSGTFQSFYQSIDSFHKNITSFYHDKLFMNKQLKQKDYKVIPQFNLIVENTSINQTIMRGLIEVMGTTFLIFSFSLVLFKKITL